MARLRDEIVGDRHIDNPLNKIVYEITSFIKNERDFNTATNLIKQNNLKLEEVVNRTARLTIDDVVKLADMLISKK